MTFLKVNFDIESLKIEALMSDKNVLPTGLRKYVFSWCGSGSFIKITLKKAGLATVRTYDTVHEFLEDTK